MWTLLGAGNPAWLACANVIPLTELALVTAPKTEMNAGECECPDHSERYRLRRARSRQLEHHLRAAAVVA